MSSIITEWDQADYKTLAAALYTYLTKQENNRDQARRKFGHEARTYGVDQRIASTNRILDRLEADYEARFGMPLDDPSR